MFVVFRKRNTLVFVPPSQKKLKMILLFLCVILTVLCIIVLEIYIFQIQLLNSAKAENKTRIYVCRSLTALSQLYEKWKCLRK